MRSLGDVLGAPSARSQAVSGATRTFFVTAAAIAAHYQCTAIDVFRKSNVRTEARYLRNARLNTDPLWSTDDFPRSGIRPLFAFERGLEASLLPDSINLQKEPQ